MKRRSVQHWLGQWSRLPSRRLTQEEVIKCYEILRHGKSVKAKNIARRRLILDHVGLGFAHASRFITGPRYHQTDEIVSQMLWGIIHGVELIEKGALDNHSYPPNISGYLVRFLTGEMLRYINYRPPELLPFPKHRKTESKLEVRELIERSIKSDQERQVVTLRAEGNNDKEIAQLMSLSPARVQQLRAAVRARWEEELLK